MRMDHDQMGCIMEQTYDTALLSLKDYKPVEWEQIPDLGLYMDQVITFIARIYKPLYGEPVSEYLSPSMINNYVKAKLIPRPAGKKYSREQIALLTMIIGLKQVTSMEDIRIMLTPAPGSDVQQLYNSFCRRQQMVIDAIAGYARSDSSDLSPALDFAILAAGYRAACEVMLNISTKP